MEKMKINGKQYTLVADGYQLREEGGRLIFQPGSAAFEAVEADLRATGELIMLDDAGSPILSRTDLVYAGRLAKDTNYVIGAEKVQTGTDSEDNPVYELQDIIGTVMIAEFRLPDVREKCAELEAQLAYVTMMTGIEEV